MIIKLSSIYATPAEVFKVLEDQKAQVVCQLYSDESERNRLDFTPTPPIPTQSIVVEKIPLNVGIYNFIRQLTP